MLVVSFTLPARGHRESNFCALQKKIGTEEQHQKPNCMVFFWQNCAKRQAKPAPDRACKVEGVVYLRETSQRLNSHPWPSIELCPAPFLGMKCRLAQDSVVLLQCARFLTLKVFSIHQKHSFVALECMPVDRTMLYFGEVVVSNPLGVSTE
jgi:hypothetical protein